MMGGTASSVNDFSTPSKMIFVNGFLVDTGSKFTIVPKSYAHEIVSGGNPHLVAANGSTIETFGRCAISLKILDKMYKFEAIVADVVQPILGIDFFASAGADLIVDPKEKCILRKTYCSSMVDEPEDNFESCRQKATELLEEFPEITGPSIGETTSMTIPLKIDTGNERPVFHNARPLYGDKKTQIEGDLLKLEEADVLERVTGPVEWAAPIHAVKKPDGSWRLCGDFRGVNRGTRRDRFPVPKMQSFNEDMAGCQIFSKFDLQSAYHQLRVAKEDRDKTTINTTLGLFRFKRVPFGLKNAGACLQRNINLILKDVPNIFVYMDDVIVASKTEEEHLDHLKALFRKLKEHNLLVSKKKSVLAQRSVVFLGHTVNKDGIRIPDARVETIRDFPRPESKKELERFLGMFAFVHRFVKHASAIVSPLQALKKAKTVRQFKKSWTGIQETAFEEAKKAIIKATLLAHPQFDAPTEIWTDASDLAVGAVLVQKQRGRWVPLGFWSRCFNDAQKKYSTFDKELLAVSYAVEHFKYYIESQPITVRTDHRPLVGAFNKASDNVTRLQRRHLNNIAQHVDELQYLEGDKNIIADACSRILVGAVLEEDDTMDKPIIDKEGDLDCCNAVLNMPSPSEFLQAQQEDKSLQRWVEIHRARSDTAFEPELVECIDTKGTNRVWADASQNPPKILVPDKFKETIMDHFHKVSHSGAKACFNMIRTTHYWPKMRQDITKWCRSCLSCQRSKVTKHTKTFLEKLPNPSARFSHIHLDLVGPFPSRSGDRMLLTIIDRWTSWPEVIVLPSGKTDAKTCAQEVLRNWCSRFGIPESLTSDRGPQFTSKVWSEMTTILGIKHITTSSYHPQSNGKIERFHRTLKAAVIAKLVENKSWEEELPWILLGLRNSPNTDTNVSPSLMVYGQQLDIPGIWNLPKEQVTDFQAFGTELAKAMKKQKFTENFWHGGQDKKGHFPETLKSCDKVLVRRDGIEPRLRPRYNGPFKVIERQNKTYKLQLPDREESISIDRLIPFVE